MAKMSDETVKGTPYDQAFDDGYINGWNNALASVLAISAGLTHTPKETS